jgi:predicted unusual protein kinase regulating ubiquinone biosynthesis (AarF/ABC1/UbiB family)
MKTGARLLNYAALARHGLRLRTSRDEAVRRNAQRHLAERMGRLRGLPQKLGQLLSMSDEPEREVFAGLQGGAEPLPFEVVEGLLETAWGRPVAQVVSAIADHGLAASLGQVHRATLLDGREVAIKVQYPGVREAVFADLKVLGWLSAPVGDLRRGFDMSDYRDEIRRDLEEELDYENEARLQQSYAEAFASLPGIVIPAVVSELSSSTVLVTAWEDGDDLEAAREWPAKARHDVGRLLLDHFCHGLFSGGLLHADPHPGNFRLRRRGGTVEVVLYDFGSVLRLPRERQLVLLRAIRAAPSDDPLRLLVALGFSGDLLRPMAQRLPAVVSALAEPFQRRYRFDLADWDLSERLSDVLGDDRWNFRISGPAHLIFFARAWQGLIHQLRTLGEPVCWSAPLAPHLRTLRGELDAVSLPDVKGASFGSLATSLCIHVIRDGATKAKITLPACCIDTIRDELNEETLKRIDAEGIDLDARVRAVRASGYLPQDVFALEDPDRSIRVWLT